MSKKWTIVVLVVAVLVVLYFWNKNGSDMSNTPGASATPSAGNSVQGTGTVTYKCDQNKSFTMNFSKDDTARLSGTDLLTMTLTKTAVDYWISADQKTVVKPAGSYIVLVQNNQTIRDRCAKQ